MPTERNNRRRFRGDEYREPVESPEQRLRNTIVRFADNPELEESQELHRVAKVLAKRRDAVSGIAQGFRIGVTEQPYKTPLYAALLLLLHEAPEEAVDGDILSPPGTIPIGKLILEDFWKGFQAFLDKQSWRDLRLCIHFFAHLTVAKVISSMSMMALLQSFAAVLDEPGVSYGRAVKAALCVGEGLIRASPILHSQEPQIVGDIISSITVFVDSVTTSKILVRPLVHFHNIDEALVGNENELLMSILSALRQLGTSNSSEISNLFPRPYADILNLDPEVYPPFDLPTVLVPPEVLEIDLDGSMFQETKAMSKREELPQYFVTLFDNDITPDPMTLAGYTIRSSLMDVVDIFEVNRKECARLLLEMPRWFTSGTFKSKPSTESRNGIDQSIVDKGWQLESTIIETILTSLLIVPESQHKPVYYHSLITELCKLSPQTVGPAVGKSIRKLHALLGDGLDVEIARRFSDWFAVHMSNFNFQWVWKEWIPDLTLQSYHPKRTFTRRALQYEVRLSYHDRIAKTLPEVMQAPDAQMVSSQPPGPEYDYDDPGHPHYDAAQSLLSLLRGRTNVNEVMNHVETLKNNIVEGGESEQRASSLLRSMTVQSLLHIGSRSFSHFLNAMERYLPLLRSMSSTPEGRADVLEAAGDFWRKSTQMISIVFDKLMQYQIADPSNVVTWAFASREGKSGLIGLSTDDWDLVRDALDKAIGRVAISKRKIAVLRKEEDDTRARVKARADGNGEMDVDAEAKDETLVEESPALKTALKGYSALTQDQRATLARVLTGFVDALKFSSPLLSESAWDRRHQWDHDQWSTWETWSWYRHYLRRYSPYLKSNVVSLETTCFQDLEDSEASKLLKRLWSTAVGQD